MKKKNKFLQFCHGILKWFSSLILTLLIIIGILLGYIFISGNIAKHKGEQPPISLYTIISPSMVPNLNVYDIVVVAKTDVSKLEKGDVISFYSMNAYFDNTPITHRIIDKYLTSGDTVTFRTKGDNNSAVDSDPVFAQNVIGKVIFKLPQLGRVQFFLASKGGWFIAILIPALGVLAYDILKLIKLIMEKNKINKIKKDGIEIGEKADEENTSKKKKNI